MTISILVFDEESGSCGGAATTGSLCVGGWVLRGDAESGLSASQGSLPSTIWGTDTLTAMRAGKSAQDAVNDIVAQDPGRHHRQLAALDPQGGVAAFTGDDSIQAAGSRTGPAMVVAGNLLVNTAVIDACFDGFVSAKGSLAERLLSALDTASKAGGDSRGLISAALLVVGRSHAPLSLRIDKSVSPLSDLRSLHAAATTGHYAEWAAHVPTLDDPVRATPYPETPIRPAGDTHQAGLEKGAAVTPP